MFQYANALNALLQAGIQDTQRDLSGQNDARIEFFDTYKFFEEIYLNPDEYFNGTAPANVTGHCHQCPNATDWHYCGV
jgi:phospholipase/lecithinase/hemolysin